MTEQRSGGGARSIRQRGDRPSENGLAGRAGEGRQLLSAQAPPRRCRGRCSLHPSLAAAPAPPLFVWSNTTPAETTQAAPLPPGSFHHVAEPDYKAGSGAQERGPLAPPPPEPSSPAAVISQIRGSPAVVYFPLRETPLEIAPQRW